MRSFLASKFGTLVLTVVLFFIIVGILMICINLDFPYPAFVLALIFAYFGWRVLNRITPAMFIWMPLVGWLFYFGFKLIISVLIGYFAAPYFFAKKISEMFY